MTKSSDLQQVFNNIFSEHSKNLKRQINVSELARVDSFNEGSKTADVTPLIDDDDGYDKAVKINSCPVMSAALMKLNHTNHYVYDALKPGMIVFIVFSNRNIDNFEGGKYKKDTERMHSMNDAVIVGRY
ncbi:Gp138 family membrane-puncturing spike protein [Apilactobacillus xinyiensis]|uniref:Gp138 family membrane-puncturing spike protein n=1 Tax=Apilactobacillus xinyiensis TaxID=2841032 RepID=UPI003364EA3C